MNSMTKKTGWALLIGLSVTWMIPQSLSAASRAEKKLAQQLKLQQEEIEMLKLRVQQMPAQRDNSIPRSPQTGSGRTAVQAPSGHYLISPRDPTFP